MPAPEHPLDLSVHYHRMSDTYYLTSKRLNEFGNPIVTLKIERVDIAQQDMREEFAVSLWELLAAHADDFRTLMGAGGSELFMPVFSSAEELAKWEKENNRVSLYTWDGTRRTNDEVLNASAVVNEGREIANEG